MSQFTDARLPLDPGQAALLVELMAIPDRPNNTWFLTKDAGVFFLDQIPSITVTVTNGLQFIGSDIGLGGSFTQDTSIDGSSTFSFGFTNTQLYVSGAPSSGNLVTIGAVSITGDAALALVATSDYNDSLICYDLNGDVQVQFTPGRLFLGFVGGGTYINVQYTTGDILLNWTNRLNLANLTQDNALTSVLCVDPLINDVYYRDISTLSDHLVNASVTDTTPGTLIDKFVAGTNITLTLNNPGGNETITIDATPGAASYYQTIENSGVPVTQQTVLNLTNLLTATDVAGKTQLTVNQANLTHNAIGGTLGVAKGGTNITSYTIGDLIYASGTTTLSKLADVAVGNVLLSGGVGVAPAYGKVDLTVHVTGVLPTANGGDAFTVKATGADTTPSDLDDKIEIVSSDSSVTVTKTIQNPAGNEKISYDLSTLISGLSEQLLGGNDAPTTNGSTNYVQSVTSATDGSVLFISDSESVGGDSYVTRYEKDTGTGMYYKTHRVQITGAVANLGLCIVGTYLYVFSYNLFNFSCDRVLATDLSGQTAMTVPTIPSVGGMAAFTDGTYLYCNIVSNTVWTQFTISGTTLTNSGTITGGKSNTVGAYYDGTYAFMVDTANNVESFTYTVGGAFVSVNSKTFDQSGIFTGNQTFAVGISAVDSTKIYLTYRTELTLRIGSTTSSNTKSLALLKPFTKPI